MATGFDVLAAAGAQAGLDKIQRKRELSDEELQSHIQQANQSIGNLQTKLSTLRPGTPEYQQTFGDLSNQIAARNDLFHPAKNPGALAKFGHMLTDAVHLTSPQQRADQQAQQKSAGQMKAEAEARLVPAGSPADPAAESARQAQAAQQQELKNWDSVIAWGQKNGLTADQLNELKAHLAGVPFTKGRPLGKPYKGADGRFYQPMEGENGEVTNEPMPPDYAPPVTTKPVRAWQMKDNKPVSVLLDPQTNQPIPGTEDATLAPPPYLTGHLSSGFYYYTDPDGHIHQVATTRSSKPDLPANTGSEPNAANPSAPKKGAVSKSNNGRSRASSGTPGDRVIGTKSTPDFTAAKKKYDDANGLASLVDRESSHPTAEGDTNLVLTLIRSEAGRVNQQEIASMFKAGGIAEAPERWAAAVHGKLPDELRKQLQQFIHDWRDSAADEMEGARPKTPGELKKKVQPPQSGKDDPLGVL